MKIAIAGKPSETTNYVKYVSSIGATPVVSLAKDVLDTCDGLVLPGGGDITPAFFGEKNHGSRHIDTELDIQKFDALHLFLQNRRPVLGICKGLQVINVALGGTILQDIPTAARHQYENGDQYHHTVILEGSWLYKLYGACAMVNSAHHQAIGKIGKHLLPIQHCPEDGCIEAIVHESLPVLGVQWHPERIAPSRSMLSGRKVLAYFVSLLS